MNKKEAHLTNTGFTYISESNKKRRIYVSIPFFSDSIQEKGLKFPINFHIAKNRLSFALTYPKLEDRKDTLAKAIEFRDIFGKYYWGKFWGDLIHEPNLLKKIPKTLEPYIIKNSGVRQYAVKYTTRELGSLNSVKTKTFSIPFYGEDCAYALAKKTIYEKNLYLLPLFFFIEKKKKENEEHKKTA